MTWTGSLREIGTGLVERKGNEFFRLELSATADQYSDAQLDDTTGRPRRNYRWSPPVRLSLRARFSHPSDRLIGTAGFGFWNVPFGPGLCQLPALPRAVWFFFGSRPHDVALAHGVPGHGWKAACLDASRPAALAWAPLTPFVLLAMQSAVVYRRLWPGIQRALGVHEAIIPVDLREWHYYALDWIPGGASFRVDGKVVLSCDDAPDGPLGFVAWMDNQYAIATPRARFGWGLLNVPEPQWLEIADLRVKAG